MAATLNTPTPAPASASGAATHAFFETAEMVLGVLELLSPHELIIARQVSKRFAATVKDQVKLKKRLFVNLKQCESDVFYEWYESEHELRPATRATTNQEAKAALEEHTVNPLLIAGFVEDCILEINVRINIGKDKLIMRKLPNRFSPQATCLDMFICKPPVTRAKLSHCSEYESARIAVEGGIQFKHLLKSFESDFRGSARGWKWEDMRVSISNIQLLHVERELIRLFDEVWYTQDVEGELWPGYLLDKWGQPKERVEHLGDDQELKLEYLHTDDESEEDGEEDREQDSEEDSEQDSEEDSEQDSEEDSDGEGEQEDE